MELRLLGPLEMERDTGLVPLGGTRQRAALAYLLLHANEVVPTRRLLSAVWPTGRAPGTARKILQNAIWRLRRTLAAPPGDTDAPELLTQAPGYMVRVAPEQVDLMRFERLAQQGRTALLRGDAQCARQSLRDALDLWHGPALSDLVEEGTAWPELTALEQKRLDVMEDRFEGELLCGEHLSVLSELDAFVQAEPLRERAPRQLMLALYRCGRQADALDVYARVRTALVEGLGLEPGREIQQLQRDILAQDSRLDTPAPLPPATADSAAHTPSGLWPGHRSWSGADSGAVPGHEGVAVTPAAPGPPGPGVAAGPGVPVGPGRSPEPQDAAPASGDGYAARRPAGVLMLRFGLGAEFDDLQGGAIDRVLDTVCELAREKMENSGGCSTMSVGSVLLGVFEEAPDRADCAERAVRAGIAIRDSLSLPASPFAGNIPVLKGLSMHAAAVTGTSYVCRWPSAEGSGRPWVGGELIDLCEAMLDSTPPGEVHVCDETRRRTEDSIEYHRLPLPAPTWQVRGAKPEAGDSPCAERDSELELMTGFLSRVRRHSTPHLITVLERSEAGRTRLLQEFHRRVVNVGADPVRVLSGTVAGPDDVLSVPATMLADYCGVTCQDGAETARLKLTAVLREVTGPDRAAELLPLLNTLVTGARTGVEPLPVLRAWRRFMAEAARPTPLVLVWNNLHRADDALLDAVEQLCGENPDVPLLAVVGARNDLLTRRPGWPRDVRHTMTMRLAPPADDALDRLLRSAFLPDGDPA
ncbi:BTAD domain-containing putative transcriptional regulator [uncultured Streptomyces sp.]|uniref:BTAD domain-containing putative transcriptional regulator n=1 Tax=uncultured Streptomyces sp. TaxID=174707 RepID=UPI0026313D85|nr:BTAD domain-containing putative transcriptional regulator [uncultured Streptomyces sp.]